MKNSDPDYLKIAVHAHTDLNTFHSVITLMEGGLIYSAKRYKTAEKIIELCKRETAKCLAEYDEAVDNLSRLG